MHVEGTMARTKGAENKERYQLPAISLSTEQRIQFIANLIVDAIVIDQLRNDSNLDNQKIMP